MSYMSNAEFAPASGIQELSFDEIDYIAGGPAWLVPLAVAAIGAVGAVAGYVTAKSTDDCTTSTTTTTTTSGDTTTTNTTSTTTCN